MTIGNLTEAYNKAAHGNGFLDEFVVDQETLDLINRYGDVTDDLHTDLHECLGHGSGQLLPGVDLMLSRLMAIQSRRLVLICLACIMLLITNW